MDVRVALFSLALLTMLSIGNSGSYGIRGGKRELARSCRSYCRRQLRCRPSPALRLYRVMLGGLYLTILLGAFPRGVLACLHRAELLGRALGGEAVARITSTSRFLLESANWNGFH